MNTVRKLDDSNIRPHTGHLSTEKDPNGAFCGERIKTLRKTNKFTQDDFAIVLGCSKNTLRRYETGERVPDADFLKRVVEVTGCDPAWLLTGEGQMMPEFGAVTPQLMEAVLAQKLSNVPILDSHAGAGPGGLPTESVIGALSVPLELIANSKPERLRAIRVEGDSMTPSLLSGDYVIAEAGVFNPVGDLFVIFDHRDGDLKVKRLKAQEGAMFLASDNPSHPALPLDEYKILGRVVAFMRKI